MKYINLETGEIVDNVTPTEKFRLHKITEYVGEDIPFPDECKDADTLSLCLKQLDSYLKNYSPILVDADYLLASVAGKHCSFKAANAVRELSKFCVGWNIGFATKSQLLEISQTDPSHFARWCKEIKSMVRVENVHLDVYRIIFNPVIVWRGDNNYRDIRVSKWYFHHK